jgi:type I restriction enzyme M protein
MHEANILYLFIHDDKLLATAGTVRKLFDSACGTGGMLAEAQRQRQTS